MRLEALLGVSTHPLPIIHAYARVTYSFPAKKLFKLVAGAFIKLNGYTFNIPLEEVKCTLEVGVAENGDFIFLGREEAVRLQAALDRRPPPRLDFIVYANYRRAGSRRSLWGDLHRVRFLLLEEGLAEIQVYHVKGTRRLSLEELLNLIFSRLEQEAERLRLPPPGLQELKGR